MSEYGINQVWGGARLLDAVLHHFPRLTRDILRAMRNPFRKRGRLILSLITLAFAGAVYMADVNLQDSLTGSLNEMFSFWRYDAWLVVEDHVPIARLVDEARALPGVVLGEGSGEDGILTADEIAAIDLTSVEWAVLSACETGVGQVQAGEGVLGLRRAFETAGVATLIMSLWEVEDEAAREWMLGLYRNRIAGMSTAEAGARPRAA